MQTKKREKVIHLIVIIIRLMVGLGQSV